LSYKKENYLSLSAILRAREARMLTEERAMRMLEAPGFSEAAKMLSDCGYDDFSELSANEIDGALNEKRGALFNELAGACPDSEIVDVFRTKYDYHNIKVLIKSRSLNIDADRLYIKSGRITPEKLVEAFDEEKYSELPEVMADAIKESAAVLARTSNPQLSDFILDNAMFSEMKALASESPFISNYVKVLIDAANLKACVRALRMGKDSDFLKSALIQGGNVDSDRLSAATSGEGFEPLFKSTVLEQAASKAAETVSGGAQTAFELACDNAVTAYLKGAKLISYGEEAVAAYIAAAENEITAVRMILSGRISDINPEILKERLRDFYA